MMAIELLQFLFTGKLSKTIVINRVKVPPNEGNGGTQFEKVGRVSIIALFSLVLSVVLVACVAAVIIFPFFDKEAPEMIRLTISGIIGYFGGAVCAFFGFRSASR